MGEGTQDSARWALISAVGLTVFTAILSGTPATDTQFDIDAVVGPLGEPSISFGYITDVILIVFAIGSDFITVWTEAASAAGWAAPLVIIPVLVMTFSIVVFLLEAIVAAGSIIPLT